MSTICSDLLNIVKLFLRESEFQNNIHITTFAKVGDLESIQLLESKEDWLSFNIFTKNVDGIVECAAGNGSLHILKWLAINNYMSNTNNCTIHAIRNNNYKTLEWIVNNNYLFDLKGCCVVAAQSGDLKTLQFLKSHYHHGWFSVELFNVADEKNHYHIIDWLTGND